MSDEYLPEVEDVRHGYAENRVYWGHVGVPEGAYIEFDRFLAARDAVVAREAKAEERAVIDAIAALVDGWEQTAGPGSRNEQAFGRQVVSVEFAVAAIRKIIARTETEGGPA